MYKIATLEPFAFANFLKVLNTLNISKEVFTISNNALKINTEGTVEVSIDLSNLNINFDKDISIYLTNTSLKNLSTLANNSNVIFYQNSSEDMSIIAKDDHKIIELGKPVLKEFAVKLFDEKHAKVLSTIHLTPELIEPNKSYINMSKSYEKYHTLHFNTDNDRFYFIGFNDYYLVKDKKFALDSQKLDMLNNQKYNFTFAAQSLLATDFNQALVCLVSEDDDFYLVSNQWAKFTHAYADNIETTQGYYVIERLLPPIIE
ncbi:hypothetical protein [Desulfonatronovibrio magnus]|uniref:hypothetical protein n=1 Tax=Desulfonatronovibrio magnus TaxID=698827 RepID=UPI0005EB662A|nr:hypothetical protein [Desulfonatronovibrio magnus]